jgi:hypothetical protein
VDPFEILSRLGTDDAPTDDELAEAYGTFGELAQSAINERNLVDATNLKKARGLIKDEQTARADARAEEDARLAELAADLETADDSPDEDDEDEPEEEAAAPSLDHIKASVRSQRARISEVAAQVNPHPHLHVETGGLAGGQRLPSDPSVGDMADLFSKFGHQKDQGRHTLVSMRWDIPDDRKLSHNIGQSQRVLESTLDSQATSFEAVAAAGGICGPLEADYTIPNIGSLDRPVRDTAFTRFGVTTRGGIRYIPADRPSLASMAEGVGIWTSDNDVSPSSPAEKPCIHVSCTDECIAKVDAITACATVGNLAAIFSQEQWAVALHQLRVAHARLAEQNLLAGIDAGSIAATLDAATLGGAIPGVLGAIDRAVAAIRSRERLSESTGFRTILDGWILQLLRSHFTGNSWAGQTGAPGVADQAIRQWFGNRGVTPTFTLDDSVYSAQTAGALASFPATTTVRVYPEGTWLYLDGGTLDLGTQIVDSTLIAVNNRQAFMETFEGTAKRTAACDVAGDDSLSITISNLDLDCVCPPTVVSSV